MTLIIGISGEKGSGKDTAALPLIDYCGFKRLSFAGPLKDAVSHAFNIKREYFEDLKRKEEVHTPPIELTRKQIIKFLNYLRRYVKVDYKQECAIHFATEGRDVYTYRELLQYLGTDIARKLIKDSIWVDIAVNEIAKLDKVIFTDVRFPNERRIIKSLGGYLVRMKRPDKVLEDGHSSENQLGMDDDYDVLFINDDTIRKLHSEIRLWASVKFKV